MAAAACSASMGRPSLEEALDRYASRAALGWQRTGVFMMTGRARLEGGNLLADGRFVFWGDPAGSRCRGDFMGPDGRPVVSLCGDSTGFTVYMPREETAWHSPGGMPAGGASMGVADLLHLVRTGFPAVTGQAEMVYGSEPGEGGSFWRFRIGPDTMIVSLDGTDLFPASLEWPGGLVEILGSTPHDEYEAWPGRWSIETSGQKVFIEVVGIDLDATPWPELWAMTVPTSVHIDTLETLPAIQPMWERQYR